MTIIKEKGQKRNDRDFYPTDFDFCLYMAAWISPMIPHGGRVLDAGAGAGVWGQALKRIRPDLYVVGVDLPGVIRPYGYDEWHSTPFELFVMRRNVDAFDLVIGNPPYIADIPQKWIRLLWRRFLKPAGKIFWLLRLAWYSSETRRAGLFHAGFHPRYVLQSAVRLSFTGDGKTDDTDYAMFLFDKSWRAAWARLEIVNYKRNIPAVLENVPVNLPLWESVQ